MIETQILIFVLLLIAGCLAGFLDRYVRRRRAELKSHVKARVALMEQRHKELFPNHAGEE